MNGEVIQSISVVAGLLAGGAVEQLAINQASKKMENLSAFASWKPDGLSDNDISISPRQEMTAKSKKIGRRVFSILGLSGALLGFSASNAIIEDTSTPPKIISQKVGLVLDRSGSMVLTTNNHQLALNQENNLLESVSSLSSNLNIETTSQGSASAQSFESAIAILPIGKTNMNAAVNDLMSNSKTIYVVSNGNGFDSTSEASQIINEAKSRHESINFYNLSGSQNLANQEMKNIAKSTGGKYYPNSYSFSAFASDIEKKLNEYAATSEGLGNKNNVWKFLGIAGLSLVIGGLAYKSRSKYIIGGTEE